MHRTLSTIRLLLVGALSIVALISTAVVLDTSADAQGTAEGGNPRGFCPVTVFTVDLALGQLPTDGDDIIKGTPGDDLIAAGAGDDIVCGMGGNDSIWGQAGKDQIWGGAGDDRIRGGADNDLVYGGDGADNLSGSTGDDEVRGQAGDDEIVRGGTGEDLVAGGNGNDLLVAGNGGTDEVRGGSGNDKITGGPRPDVLLGGPGNDLVLGHKGADKLFGETGDDDLRGGPQPDEIDGGDGNDTCNGGTTGEGAPELDAASASCETELNIEVVLTPPQPEIDLFPGEGVAVRIARANWYSGYVQAEITRRIIEQLGYTVSDPASLEFAPDLGYLTIAQGEADLWVNSWMPIHLAWFEQTLADGSKVGDHLTVTGNIVPGGGSQGYLISADFAAAYGLTSLDDLNANLNGSLTAYDQTDVIPNNGKADIFGCPTSWTCDDVVNSQIAFSGWSNIAQISAGYDAMVEAALTSLQTSVPTVIYTWTPTNYIGDFAATNNIAWIGPLVPLDDSNPLGLPGGDTLGQGSGIGQTETVPCLRPASGLCHMGFEGQFIQATANTDFYNSEPAIASLLNSISIGVVDASNAAVAADFFGVESIAATWMLNNQATVDQWLADARLAAAGQTAG